MTLPGAPSVLRLGAVADSHLAPAGTPPACWHNAHDLTGAHDRLAAALALLGSAGVDAVAVLGDLAHLGDDVSLDAGTRLLEAAGLPVFVVPGNHDCSDPGQPRGITPPNPRPPTAPGHWR